MIYKEHNNCRICGSTLTPYLDLGMMPLSNNLAESTVDEIHNQRYPLKVCFCENCGLSQLSVVIPPEKLFSNYVYRSGMSQGYINHCRKMAVDLKERYGLTKDSFHIDIAGNDGTLLKEFKDEIGERVLNIDPAKNLAGISESAGVPMKTAFWGLRTSQNVIYSHGKADLITATNVFAHVDDVKEFLSSVKETLKENGVLVLEFPYLVDFIEKVEFDTIYFEHLSYFSILPLSILCDNLDMIILSVTKQEIHGGTVRVIIGNNGNPEPSVKEFIYNEIGGGYWDIEKYSHWSTEVQESIMSFREGIIRLKNTGARIAAFAASAKGNTLLNSAGITVGSVDYITDETPEKIGKYSPGTRIPIVSMFDLKRNPPDYLIILSWNFKDEIIGKVSKFYKGKYILPIPSFEILD